MSCTHSLPSSPTPVPPAGRPARGSPGQTCRGRCWVTRVQPQQHTPPTRRPSTNSPPRGPNRGRRPVCARVLPAARAARSSDRPGPRARPGSGRPQASRAGRQPTTTPRSTPPNHDKSRAGAPGVPPDVPLLILVACAQTRSEEVAPCCQAADGAGRYSGDLDLAGQVAIHAGVPARTRNAILISTQYPSPSSTQDMYRLRRCISNKYLPLTLDYLNFRCQIFLRVDQCASSGGLPSAAAPAASQPGPHIHDTTVQRSPRVLPRTQTSSRSSRAPTACRRPRLRHPTVKRLAPPLATASAAAGGPALLDCRRSNTNPPFASSHHPPQRAHQGHHQGAGPLAGLYTPSRRVRRPPVALRLAQPAQAAQPLPPPLRSRISYDLHTLTPAEQCVRGLCRVPASSYSRFLQGCVP